MIELGLSPSTAGDPEEVAALRRLVRMQWAVGISVVLHLSILIVALLLPEPKPRRAEEVTGGFPPDEPVTITFNVPPPPASPPPQPRAATPPPPPADPASRFKTEAARLDAIRPEDPDRSREDKAGRRGMKDDRPAGGRAGGDLPAPAPGVPGSSSSRDRTASNGAAPGARSLEGRLKEFAAALREATPPAESGPRGGGSGSGGIDLSSLPGTGFGFGNLEFESGDYDWNDYGRAIYWAIWRAWHNRMLISVGNFEGWAARRGNWSLEDHNRVRFTITRSGEVVDVALETPSGCRPLDDSALDALREVVLPRLPDDFPEGRETVRARFVADVDVRSMRSGLSWLKERGYF